MGLGALFRSKRSRRRAAYAVLVREALIGIHTVVERDAQIDSIGILFSLSEEETQWLDIIIAMVDTLRDDHPMSTVLICFLLDTIAIPTAEAMELLSLKFLKRVKRASLTPAQARNIAVVWSIYAEKLAGRQSTVLFSEPCCKALLRMLQDYRHPIVQLHALLALEKFSLTTENKDRVLAQADFVSTLRALEAAEHGRDPIRHQLRFAARWSLDNLFPSPNRDFGLDPRRMMAINVMLNKADQTDFLKLSRHGLEARNDADSFESVRGTMAVTSGSWFYEVMVFSAGILQIGWATKHCLFESQDGGGVGDDANSIAFDGCRRRIWHRGLSVEYGTRAWRPGDVIGVYLDMEYNTLAYTLNGEELGNAMALLDPPVNFHNMVAADQGLYPAVSMIIHQHCSVNFGDRPFRHAPRGNFRTLNSAGTLPMEQRIVMPRLAQRLSDLRLATTAQDDSVVRCQICCDRPQGCMLLPCRHTGFCTTCAIQCEICPICRQPIEERAEPPVAVPPPPAVPAPAPDSMRGFYEGGIPINADSLRNSSAGRRSNNSASTRSLWLGTANFRPSVLGAGSRSPSPGNTLQRREPSDGAVPPSPVPSVSSRSRPSPVPTLTTRSEQGATAAGRSAGQPTPPPPAQPPPGTPGNRTPPGSLGASGQLKRSSSQSGSLGDR